ncbi:MAG: MlaE family lipid ABC transporter permease subunit [Deltaproteobacteria bacterium]|jgi:phospholipid/cholesterol/gamma-HCH transport system permease protein|nr:MlaE family lipid ABC transporter permease subunit [Deltaproteobacteria bacterium]
MDDFKDNQACRYEISESNDGEITIYLHGRIDSSNASQMIDLFGSLIKDRRPVSLTVDLKKVKYLDDFGALVLVELKDMMTAAKGQFNLKNAREEVLFILNSGALAETAPLIKARPPSMFIRFGDAIIKLAADVKYQISFVGSICLAFFYSFLHPKSLRMDDIFLYMQKTGVDAVPIVGMISFMMGLIMAFMSSIQLQMFGANIYVASLVSLAMTRELGPIMTAIIVAGRSGSSFASEIGTMKISEEVDALFTMGFDPTRYLVVPKIMASVFVVPILTVFSDVFAILGGLTVGVLMLDLTANAYILQTLKTLSLFDILLGIFKSAVFALLISWIGCLRGFRVQGGAASVGQATTSAVVSSIFLIIVFDSIFAVMLRYLS